MYSFTIPGQPMGKQRPKFARIGKFTRTYTPKETTSYENLVKLAYKGNHFGKEPIVMHIKAYYKVPASYSMKKKMDCVEGRIRPTTKPDCDNVAKIICDSLNTIAYDDDKQIVKLIVEKNYSLTPRVEVMIGEK